MAYIIQAITLEQVKQEEPETIWYGVNTCWWTHRQEDVRVKGENDMPCDPRGGMLMMGTAREFIAAAEANPAHYGEHGMEAFIAAHNDNCVVSFRDSRNTCMETWGQYNEQLDVQTGGVKGGRFA